MKDREIITPYDDDDIANRRAAAYEREIERGDYLRDEQQDRIAGERSMSPGEKWEADYEASRLHIGKTKEETMTREQLVKYVRQLKCMIANLQTANAGLSADKTRLDWLIQNHAANFECVEMIAGNQDRYHIPATREAIDAEISLPNDKDLARRALDSE